MTRPTVTERAPGGADGSEAFNSFAELVDYVLADAAPAGAGEWRMSRWAPPSQAWDFGAGWHGALELYRNGWPAGTARVMGLASEWSAGLAPSIKMPGLTYATEGMDWDLDAVLRGAPEAWVEPIEVDARAVGVVRVVANLATSAGVSAEVYATKGAAVLALVWLLESAGRPVELIAVDRGCNRERTHSRQVMVRVKEAGAPLDVDRLAVLVAHPAGYRRLVFGALERFPLASRVALGIDEGGAYGIPYEVADYEQGDVYIGCARAGGPFQNDRTARAWIEAELRKQGALR